MSISIRIGAITGHVSRLRKISHSILLAMVSLCTTAAVAQVRQLIQVKTFDEQLQPLKNVELSINNKTNLSTGSKGVVFVEMAESDLPVKTIKIKNEGQEAGAWNYSKSTLEIIVRKKSYRMMSLLVRDGNGIPQRNLSVTFIGRKSVTATTNPNGFLELPVSLDEKVNSTQQFTAQGFDVVDLLLADAGNILTVLPVRSEPKTIAAQTVKPVQENTGGKGQANFDASKLDSVTSLAEFQSVFTSLLGKNLDGAAKEKLNRKFDELVVHLQDSIRQNEDLSLTKISGTSYVGDDIQSLLKRADRERAILKKQREDFDNKVKLIDEKLAKGMANLDDNTRDKLLVDIRSLEELMAANESQSNKNQDDYRVIIGGMKERYFDFETLENKLSESEAQRIEEQKSFHRQLFAVSIVVFTFIVLTFKLVRASNGLKRQKKQLEMANGEVQRINENLEVIVQDRTKLLEEAHRELDTFLYRASHDLRSPVCSIIGLCNIAIHISEGESKELVKRVVSTTEGMDKLLKKLSIISEINQPTGYSQINLHDILENVQYKFRNLIHDTGVEIEIDCPADLTFYSYPNLVEVIVMNLVENAIFYSSMQRPVDARVSFRADLRDNQVEISIRDNGIGLEDSTRPRIFDMFFKGNAESKGNGLGLYIVQKSVQALEGTIAVDSEIGSYTHFVVRLPLRNVPVNEDSQRALA